ncbi:hypothetical protein BH11PAT4_BH11PAT4_2750 [soil metagenome]
MSPKKAVSTDEITELVDLELPEVAPEDEVTVDELESEGHVAPHTESTDLEVHQYSEETPVGFNLERAMKILESLEHDVRTLRGMLAGTAEPFSSTNSLPGFMTPASHATVGQYFGEDDGVEGTFDGERMVDTNGKSYQVPPNYASKSKLIEGDPLKLYIGADGKYVYKQLGPVERRNVGGVLRMEGNHYVVDSDEGHTYGILTACVTYYIALYSIKPGDRVMIMIPATGLARWAVIDNPA